MQDLLNYDSDYHFIHVDDWIPEEKDIIFKHTKGYMVVPLIDFFKLTGVNQNFDYFVLNSKKGYNKPKLRTHTAKYINYFLKFYDPDKELMMIYYKMKTVMDGWTTYYSKEAFLFDIKKYFLSISMMYKINKMNDDNYRLKINLRKKSVTTEGLKYDDTHGKILLKLSLIINLIIPLLTHFMTVKLIQDSKSFLLEVYDMLLSMFDIDIYNKLYETAMSIITDNMKDNSIWQKQDIRGINSTIHAIDSVENILLNIIPKYIYSSNIVVLNYISINYNINYKVTRPGYEFEFNPLSTIPENNSSDEDSAGSQFDKFENTLTKENEGLYIQNKVNCEQTMKKLFYQYPIDDDEIVFYVKQLMNNQKFSINPFQKELVFDLFYRLFGDVVSIKAINRTDYIKLIIIAKRCLLEQKFQLLPYIIGGKVVKLNERKDLNTKQRKKMEGSQFYPLLMEKYKNLKIIEDIRSIIATILASEFNIIDYSNPDLNGQKIELLEDYIIEEVQIFALII